ncbi:MAG: radical SAM protein [Elusimicrobiota bacterium]
MTRPVFLIWPADISRQSALYPPLGLAYLYSALQRRGITATMVDLAFDPALRAMAEVRAQGGIYGLSFTTSMIKDVRRCVEMIRRSDPEGVIVMGGPHATVFPEACVAELDADFVLTAEGENSFPELVAALSSGEECGDLPGLVRRTAGAILRNPAAEPIPDLDALPVPDQSVFPVERYFALKGFRELSMYTSRGCPGRCTFCQPTLDALFGKKIRYHSASRIVSEMEELAARFKLDLIVMSDDTFAVRKDRVQELCRELIRRNVPVFWRVQTRVKGLDRETVRLMKRAGCVAMAFGVESGSQKILDGIRKNVKIADIKEIFRVCREEGMPTHAFLMVGNFGESEETIRETEALLREIKPFSSNVSVTTPYPGTYLFDQAAERGLLKHRDWEKFDHILSDSLHLELDGLTVDDLNAFKKRLLDVQDHTWQRIATLFKLAFDYWFIRRALKLVLANPGFVLRALRAAVRGVARAGFELTNPRTKATRIYGSAE